MGVSVALLIAVLAAIAFFWNVSHRQAGHSPIAAPIARAEPLATPPISESASDPAADPPAAAAAAPATPSEEQAADEPAAAQEEEKEAPAVPTLSAHDQSQIEHVINDGRPGIQTCYERALVRDPTLVRGNLKVRVAVTASGHPRRVSVHGPSAFREKMTPCLETAVSSWRFPTAAAAYEAQFPLVLRGSE